MFDNSFMFFRVFALGLAACLSLRAETPDIHQKAVPAQGAAKSYIADADSDDEIDQAISSYLKNYHKSSKSQFEQARNDKIFKSPAQKSTFKNAARKESGSSDEHRIINHTVESSDSLHAIAMKYAINAEEIIKHNPELKKRPIFIGEELFILREPQVEAEEIIHTVQPGETIASIAKKYRIASRTLLQLNGLTWKSRIKPGQNLSLGKKQLPAGYIYRKKFILPLQGPITSRFGSRSNPFVGSRQYHKGIDIGAPLGARVQAAGDGIVVFATRMSGYGNCIFIRHSDGFISVYGHNRKLLVARGDVVKQGQDISEVGRTGTATGPHLHFEIRKWATPLNPLAALRYTEAIPADAAFRMK